MKLEKELTYNQSEIPMGNDWTADIITSEENLKLLKELAKKINNLSSEVVSDQIL